MLRKFKYMIFLKFFQLLPDKISLYRNPPVTLFKNTEGHSSLSGPLCSENIQKIWLHLAPETRHLSDKRVNASVLTGIMIRETQKNASKECSIVP